MNEMMLQYVDDAVLLARSPEELQHMIKDIAGGKSYQAVRSPWDEGMDFSETETEDEG